MNVISILGVDIHQITTDQAADFVNERLKSGQKTAIATINPEFIVHAQADQNFRNILNNSNLALADGVGLLWAANLLTYETKSTWPIIQFFEILIAGFLLGIGTVFSSSVRHKTIPEKITGVDFSCKLALLAAEKYYSIFLLGETSDIAKRTARYLTGIAPGLRIAGTFSGNGAPEGDEQTAQRVGESLADIVFVAYGAPKQEYWIHRNLQRLPATVAIGVGGTFMYLSGQVKRAPMWVRNLGLEWLHRLITQPWRWRRQLALPKFMYLVYREKLKTSSNNNK